MAISLTACGAAESGVTITQEEPVVAPTLFAPEDLGQKGRVTLSPAFAPDGNTIYFTQADCERIWNCPQLLMKSERTADGWSRPQIVPLSQENRRSDWPSVSPDGKTLLFSWAPDRARHIGQNVDVDFDLFRLDLTDKNAVPQPIDEPDINRIRGGKVRTLRFVHNETAPVLTTAGDLYFWTERLDGVGLRDVYVARSDGKGGFQKATALPAPINLPDDNSASWLNADGTLMILSSDRGTKGGGDLFVSVLDGETWSEPESLGLSINSDFSEFAGRVSPDGKTLVFSSDRPAHGGEAGLLQVWQMPVSAVPVLRGALSRAEK